MIALLLAASFACPDDQVIGLDIKPWKADLLADVPGTDEQKREMRALRMKLVPDGNESEDECYSTPKVEGVDVFDSNLTGQKDKLIQVRFRMCKGKPEEWISQRIAVLVPLPDGKHCLLGGEDLSVDRAKKDMPCGQKLPLTLSFKEMTEKGRNVVETRDFRGSCEKGQGMLNAQLYLYEARGTGLEKIFDTVLFESNATAGGQTLTQRYKITYGPTVPKTIHVERCLQGCDVIGDYAWSKADGKYTGK